MKQPIGLDRRQQSNEQGPQALPQFASG